MRQKYRLSYFLHVEYFVLSLLEYFILYLFSHLGIRHNFGGDCILSAQLYTTVIRAVLNIILMQAEVHIAMIFGKVHLCLL